MTESDILAALAAKHADDVWFAGVKLGPSWGAQQLRIMDGLAIKKSWANPCFTGYEVKTTRSDFLRDEKWPGYLPACHRFYWACPRGLIKMEEVDDQCGLVYVKDNGNVYTRKKAIYRNIELPEGLLYYLILSRADGLIPDGESDEDAAHRRRAQREDTIRAWLADKAKYRELGWELAAALPTRLAEAEVELNNTKRQLDEWKKAAKELGILAPWALRHAIDSRPTDPALGHLPRLRKQLSRAVEAIDEVQAKAPPTGGPAATAAPAP